jgi:outer membrane protein TolC
MLSSAFMSLRRRARAIPVLAVLFALPVAAADLPDIAGTFPEDYLPELRPILATALHQSYQVIAKQIEMDQSNARVYGANAARLPGVSGSLTYAVNKSATSDNSSESSRSSGVFYGFGVSQALYHWGQLQNETDKARIGVLITQKNYTEAMRSLAVSLRRGYMDLIVRKLLLLQIRTGRELTEKDLAFARQKKAEGVMAEAEVTGRELNLKDVALRAQRAEMEFAGMRRSFARLAGIGDISEEAIPVVIPKPTYSPQLASALLAAVVRDSGHSTYQAVVAELRVKEADLNYRNAKVRQLPMFNAGASYSLENNTSVSTTAVNQVAVTRESVYAVAQWNIFDGFATKGAKLESLAAKRGNELQLRSVSEAAVDSATSLSQQLSLDAQELEMAELRFGLGKVATSALDGGTAAVKQSESTAASARANFLSHWIEFASVIGADPVINQPLTRNDREKR